MIRDFAIVELVLAALIVAASTLAVGAYEIDIVDDTGIKTAILAPAVGRMVLQ